MGERAGLPRHGIVQLREWPVCRRVLARVYREFESAEEVRRWMESDRPEGAIPVLSLPCPQCDGAEDRVPATHIGLYVDGEMVGPPAEIRSWAVPVAGSGASGPVALDPERVAAEDAAHYVFSRWPPELFAEFGETYAFWAVSSGRHRSVWNRWDAGTWREVLAEAGLSARGDEREWRRLAEGHAREVMEAWVKVLVRRIQRVGLRVWAERAREECDPWTVEFVLSGIPLPEGLEHLRTEALGRLVRRPERGEAALWRRLRALQGELDRARSRAGELGRKARGGAASARRAGEEDCVAFGRSPPATGRGGRGQAGVQAEDFPPGGVEGAHRRAEGRGEGARGEAGRRRAARSGSAGRACPGACCPARR